MDFQFLHYVFKVKESIADIRYKQKIDQITIIYNARVDSDLGLSLRNGLVELISVTNFN